jgi:hypothetical protein
VLAAVVTAVVTFSGAPASAATAAPGTTLSVRQDATGQVAIQKGRTLRAGLEHVDITSAFASGDPETFQLHPGATLERMGVEITTAGNWQVDPAAAAAAMRWFTNTTFYGGLSAQGAVSYQTVLSAGCYYVAQVNNPSATARSFQVVGSSNAHLPVTAQSLRMIEPDTFVASGSGHFHAGPTLIANDSGELHFARFVQAAPGTTDADVSAWFAGGADPTLAGGRTLSFGTQSPGRSAVLDLALPVGTYMVLDFIPDDQSGIPHAFGGMHTVVTVS